MAADLDWHLRRYATLVSERGNFDDLYQSCAEFIFPGKAVINEQSSPGDNKHGHVFDGTAEWANKLLAAALMGTLTSPAYPWFTLRMRDEELNDDPEVADWLEECQRRMYLALRQSNFNAEMMEVYLDLGAFGQAALHIEERQKVARGFAGFVFKALALGGYVIAENAEGIVDTVYRCVNMTARQCLQRWGARCGPEILKMAEDHPDKTLEVIHAIYPRADWSPERLTGAAMPIASVWFCRAPKHLLSEGGYHEMPTAVPRWSKTPGEVYGRGPGLTALPDVRTLNRAVEMTLRNAAKKIDPSMMIPHDGVHGDVDLRAGGTTIMEDGKEIKPIESGGDFDVSQILTADLRVRILKVFYYEQLQLQDGPAMTATEVERRVEMMQRLLGPTIARLEPELLRLLIDRCFAIMLREGAFPEVPELLLETLGQSEADIDIEYEGPLAKAQRSSQVAALEQWLLLAGKVAEVRNLSPETVDVMDLDEALRDAGRIRGLPSQWLRAPAQIEEIRGARTQAIEQQNQLAQGTQIAEAAGKAAPALKVLEGARQGAPAAA